MASILGPLLGGVLVDNASWRWIFYVNIPLGLGSLVVLGIVCPALASAASRSSTILGAGLSAIVLVTSLGGNTWAWDSAQVVIIGALGLVLLAAFYNGDVVEVLDRLARDLAAGRPRELARG